MLAALMAALVGWSNYEHNNDQAGHVRHRLGKRHDAGAEALRRWVRQDDYRHEQGQAVVPSLCVAGS